jgi:DNA repair photolyase
MTQFNLPTSVPVPGRGASANPGNRFETLHYELEPDDLGEDSPSPRTEYLIDSSRSFIAYNDSPDVGFSASINPYRGCEHGCIYCYARPTHEYLGFSAGLDFETRILVKPDAPNLLRAELCAPGWQPQVLGISGVTDCYQPIERHLRVTRRCLEVLEEFRNPLVIITKSKLVTRDVDVLARLAEHRLAGVFVSITSLDASLSRTLEPRASLPTQRLDAVKMLAEAGIPTGVLVAPVIPGLTDHLLPSILSESAANGARFASYVMLRLPLGVAPLFERWLEQHFPDSKEKVLGRIRDLRGGQLNDPRFGARMRGEGILADSVKALFQMGCRRAGVTGRMPELATESFRNPPRPATNALSINPAASRK